MKLVLIFIFVGTVEFCHGQTSFIELSSPNHYEISNGKASKVNRPMVLIYDKNTFGFYEKNVGWKYFNTSNYSSKINPDGGLHEDFSNDETAVTPANYYIVNVDKEKDGITFQIILPTDFTYAAENAKAYSESGKTGTAYISDIKLYKMSLKRQDSINALKKEQEIVLQRNNKINDSIAIVQRDSLARTKYTTSLQKGNNFNKADVNWLLDTIKANVVTDLYFLSDFKITVDKNGVITGAAPTNNMAPADDKCIADINKAIIGKKITPFIAKNGKQYPSYCNLYISLQPSPIKQKGRAGFLLRSIHF